MQKIVFVRHAHRDKPTPDRDNGISDKGLKQTEALVEAYESENIPQGKYFWTSPKKRCIETLKPVAASAGAPLVVEPLLDEQGPSENMRDFVARIEKLIAKATIAKGTVYLCSHGDFIPEAIDMLTGRQVEVKKAQALVLVGEDRKSPEGHASWELL